VATGLAAPDTVITAFDGTSVTLSDYSGSPVVVNFWASWCPSCVAELGAAIQSVFEAVGDDVAFVGVNIQDERAAALEMIEETGVEFDLDVDQDGDLFLAFGAIGMPFTALIDADGRVVERHSVPLTESQLLDLIGEAFQT
jgi:thiol-disulfide isomerase/thioredoxin